MQKIFSKFDMYNCISEEDVSFYRNCPTSENNLLLAVNEIVDSSNIFTHLSEFNSCEKEEHTNIMMKKMVVGLVGTFFLSNTAEIDIIHCISNVDILGPMGICSIFQYLYSSEYLKLSLIHI